MSITTQKALIEIDHKRGVIYVHSNSTGKTILRICNLPEIPKTDELLDITHLRGCNWKPNEENINIKEK